jgi:inosine-uridine nucleoside N-ribohydrolase
MWIWSYVLRALRRSGGVVKNGKTPDDSAMIRVPAERRKADGSYVYPHKIADGREAPDAVMVLRRVLAAETNGSVVMVVVGFSTNLARLLNSPPDALSPCPARSWSPGRFGS